MKKTSEVEAIRFYKDKAQAFRHDVIHEEPLALFINDEPYATLMRLPGNEKELVTGFLLTEGLIKGKGDILYMQHCGSGEEEMNRVDVKLAGEFRPVSRKLEVSSACGLCSRTYIDNIQKNLEPLNYIKPLTSVSVIRKIERDLSRHQKLHKVTGAAHAAALYDINGRLLALMEDIGRHNALDKLIGHALLQGWDLSDKIVISSGRASFEMAYKTIAAKIPVLATVSAPTCMAINMSRRFNLTLISFLREEGFNLYTHSERIALNEES